MEFITTLLAKDDDSEGTEISYEPNKKLIVEITSEKLYNSWRGDLPSYKEYIKEQLNEGYILIETELEEL